MYFSKDGFANISIFIIDVFLFLFTGAIVCTRIHKSSMLYFLYPQNSVLYSWGSTWWVHQWVLSGTEHVLESTAYLRMPFCTCGHRAVPPTAFSSFTPAPLDGYLDRIKTQVKNSSLQGCKLTSHLPHVHGLCLGIGLSAAFRWPSASTGRHLMRWCLWDPINSAPDFEPLLIYMSLSAKEAIMRVERRGFCSAVLDLGHLPALKECP